MITNLLPAILPAIVKVKEGEKLIFSSKSDPTVYESTACEGQLPDKGNIKDLEVVSSELQLNSINRLRVKFIPCPLSNSTVTTTIRRKMRNGNALLL